jgi:hypothetical protein
LATVRKIERLDSGGMYVTMQGIKRFWVKSIITDKPTILAKVNIFSDYYHIEDNMDEFEQTLLSEIRYSVKVMAMLYPKQTYILNDNILRYRPPLKSEGVRYLKVPGLDSLMGRRAKFSFAVMEMLRTDVTTKLTFLQQASIDKRYYMMNEVSSNTY